MPGYDPDEPCIPLSAVRWPSGGPPLIEAAWRTDTVLALARTITQSGTLDLIPILADALEDAGCDNQYVLNHCRRCPAHLAVCWVVSAVLRNPPGTKQRPSEAESGKYRCARPTIQPKPHPSVTALWVERVAVGCHAIMWWGVVFFTLLFLLCMVIGCVLAVVIAVLELV